MNHTLLLLISVLFFSNCGQSKLTHQETVTSYFEARDAKDYHQIKQLISDSLIVTEGSYVMPYSQESYYEVFKWDSIFRTTYDLVDLQKLDDQILASVNLTSVRNTFLENDLMRCDFRVSFEKEKISRIESLDCQGADWDKWQDRVKLLVVWVEENHPELDGFIHDMTMKGAQDYVNSIELYEARRGEE